MSFHSTCHEMERTTSFAGLCAVAVCSALLLSAVPCPAGSPIEKDLVVYGGTPAGLAAAIAAARQDATIEIVVVEPTRWIGGLVTGGLSRTDTGDQRAIGGLAREYFERAKEIGGEGTPMWYAEPKANMAAFHAMLAECGSDQITVLTERRLTGVTKQGNRIRSIQLDDGTTIAGRLFIDAAYEGDLMAAAGVRYAVGRESRKKYDEPLAGFYPVPIRHRSPETMSSVCPCLGGDGPHFIHGAPAEIRAFDDAGELLPGITPPQPGVPGGYPPPGSADNLTQSYNVRLCVTRREDIRVPFPKPQRYDPARYALLLRLIETYPDVRFGRLVHLGVIAHGKHDLNAQGLFSTDYVGGNTAYPDGDARTRAAIHQDHIDYIQGFLWFLGHDPRVPKRLRDEVNEWGLCADEFVDNEHWSYALYVREARRMVGEYVMRQQDTWQDAIKPDSIGMGSFLLDCHIVQRIVTEDGFVTDEGSFPDTPTRPYQIPYRAVLPRRTECENLLVPVCLSASHIAYGSIRMEPVYMTLGHAGGVAAAMATAAEPLRPTFHDVPVDSLQDVLRQQGAVLELAGIAEMITIASLPGLVLDDRDAECVGVWRRSPFGHPVEGLALHDANSGKGSKRAVFRVANLAPGRYEVRLSYTSSSNRARAVPVTIDHADGSSTRHVNQTKPGEHDGLFTTLGTFRFSGKQPAVVTVSNAGTDSYVSVDAVQFLPEDPASK